MFRVRKKNSVELFTLTLIETRKNKGKESIFGNKTSTSVDESLNQFNVDCKSHCKWTLTQSSKAFKYF